MCNDLEKGRIKCLQLNAAHRFTTHNLLMLWLNRQEDPTILLIQEPYVTRKGVSGIPKGYECFWGSSSVNEICMGKKEAEKEEKPTERDNIESKEITSNRGDRVSRYKGRVDVSESQSKLDKPSVEEKEGWNGLIHDDIEGEGRNRKRKYRNMSVSERCGDERFSHTLRREKREILGRKKGKCLKTDKIGFEPPTAGFKAGGTTTREIAQEGVEINSGKEEIGSSKELEQADRGRAVGKRKHRNMRVSERCRDEYNSLNPRKDRKGKPSKKKRKRIETTKVGIEPSTDRFKSEDITTRVSALEKYYLVSKQKRKRTRDKQESAKWGKGKKICIKEQCEESHSNTIDKKRVRAMIIAPKNLKCYMVTQYSSRDCVVIRCNTLRTSFASVYCDSNEKIDESMWGVCMEVNQGKKVVVCADTNAHSCLWGASGKKKNRFKSYARGDALCAMLDDLNLYVCNVIPHVPTYQGGTGHLTYIDITFCTSDVHDRINDWRVGSDKFESDHRAILFNFGKVWEGKIKEERSSQEIGWIRPNESMVKVMKGSLPKMVGYKRRMGREDDVELFVQKHTKEVQEALSKIFQKKNTKGKTPCYWWSTEVSKAHIKLKKAKRKKERYKYERFIWEYNVARSEFRKEMRKAKIEAWKSFTSNIEDPWKGLVKILKSQNINKSQDRTLCYISGCYSNDVESTLEILSEQFYPTPSEVNKEQLKIEEEVHERLKNVEMGKPITICEFRKALEDMRKAKAPGEDQITNCVLHVLAKDCKYEKQYVSMYNACLKLGCFPKVWKIAKIVLIPKPTDMLDSVKAFRPISLTSVYSKLLERIVLARIMFYIELSGKLALNQHAYRKGVSTTSALYEVTKFLQDALYDKQVCLIVFLDISGAFDRTWHGGILYRLLQYGVPAYLVRWVRSFLTDRSAHFEVAGIHHRTDLSQGCPQGGVLSPVLWNVMFNDVMKVSFIMPSQAVANQNLEGI